LHELVWPADQLPDFRGQIHFEPHKPFGVIVLVKDVGAAPLLVGTPPEGLGRAQPAARRRAGQQQQQQAYQL